MPRVSAPVMPPAKNPIATTQTRYEETNASGNHISNIIISVTMIYSVNNTKNHETAIYGVVYPMNGCASVRWWWLYVP